MARQPESGSACLLLPKSLSRGTFLAKPPSSIADQLRPPPGRPPTPPREFSGLSALLQHPIVPPRPPLLCWRVTERGPHRFVIVFAPGQGAHRRAGVRMELGSRLASLDMWECSMKEK